MILFDSGWFGEHGIGRFSSELACRLDDLVFSKRRFFAGMRSDIKGCYSPGYRPYIFSKRFVFTLHDLNHIDVNYNSSIIKRLYYETFVRYGIVRAYRVVTVSEFSKKRIVKWSGCDPQKVVVVGNGVSQVFSDNTLSVKMHKPFFFCVSNRKGHKNEKRLIDSFFVSGLYLNYTLQFSGEETAELVDLIQSKGLQNSVFFTGKLSEQNLAEWYRGATALVFPSLYEGFGLPVVEAMASGTPVITSDCSSLPEVGGDAAIYVDPYNEIEISDAMVRVANDSDLRDKMCERGLLQAKKYSWDRTAAKVSQILEEMVDA